MMFLIVSTKSDLLIDTRVSVFSWLKVWSKSCLIKRDKYMVGKFYSGAYGTVGGVKIDEN